MKAVLRRKPSASMVVAIMALVVAASGTAVAAGRMSGDKLIKKHSLSGNRLRNHTVTGKQIKLSSLGKVPSAANADNANSLSGHSLSSFEPSGVELHWGNVTISKGGTDVPVAKAGPFTLTAQCLSSGTGQYELSSSVAAVVESEDGGEIALTPGTPQVVNDDEDYDEAFYAWAPSTGASINGTPFNWSPTDSNVGGSNCEFQGIVFKTS